MAATERLSRRARRRRRRTRSRLPYLAAGLGALAARDAYGQSSIDTRFLFYKESGGRTQVLNPVVLLHQDFGDKVGAFNLNVGYDSISGASPTGGYPSLTTVTSASGHTSSAGTFPMTTYTDHRESVGLSYTKKLGDHLPSIDVSYAKENDYVARGFGFTDAWTMLQGRGTLHFGASFARDLVEPVTNSLSLPKDTNGYSLGWTWILTERDLIDVSGSLMKLTGYLDDPYKQIPIGTAANNTLVDEHRPDSRSRWVIVAKYGHSYYWNGALKLNYRYYWDDWQVKAHTLEAIYDQYLGAESQWLVTPRVRLYTQSAASFYGSLFATPQPYMSSDYRLSSLYSILGGLTVARKIDDRLSVNAGFALQSQTGRDQVAPVASGTPRAGGSGTTASAADLNVTTITVGFTWTY